MLLQDIFFYNIAISLLLSFSLHPSDMQAPLLCMRLDLERGVHA